YCGAFEKQRPFRQIGGRRHTPSIGAPPSLWCPHCAVSKRSLSAADLKPNSQYPRPIGRCAPTGHIVLARIIAAAGPPQPTRGHHGCIEINGGFRALPLASGVSAGAIAFPTGT